MENKTNSCVVTGLGLISAIGNSVSECWENAVKSVSGIQKTETVDTANCYANLAAEVKDESLNKMEGFENKDRVTKLCIKAVKEALQDAKLGDFEDNPRVSVIMGSCVGGAVSIESYFKNGKNKEDIIQMPISAIASQVAQYCHAGGTVTNIANACAAGTISISYACDLIRSGKADIVVAGGTDAFASVPYAGFLALHALDANPCSPFNHCSGITLGEGAGCVIVESLEHAQKRNAKMYCYVLGSGISSDAFHITAPRPDGLGQMCAIHRALASSDTKENEIGYINAHGTGTAKNDNAEFLSLHTIFDNKNLDLSVSSTKAMVGHCLGAAGAIEAVFSIKALTENVVPATLGYSDEDLLNLKEKAKDIDFVPNKSRKKELTEVMSNSFAFGGNNASIIFSKKSKNVRYDSTKKSIAITGIGIVSPIGNDVENYISACNQNSFPQEISIHSTVGDSDYTKLGLQMSFYRKLDNFCQLQAVSGMYALKDANLNITEENAFKTGIVVGTSEGALGTCLLFEENIAEKGNAFGSAFKFPNTVYNAAGGYLSICSGIKGYNVTSTNGAQSGLSSIGYAMNILNRGDETAILTSGTDENIDIIYELYEKLGYNPSNPTTPYSNGDGFVLGDGSTSILIETEESAKERNAHIYAHVLGYAMAHKGVEFGTLTNSESALTRAILEAISDAGLTIEDIDTISGFANGLKNMDTLEIESYQKIFGKQLTNMKILSVKGRTGEGRAASASLACAHAALLIDGKLEKDDCCYKVDENGNVQKCSVLAKDVHNVLVTSYGVGGTYTALVISK